MVGKEEVGGGRDEYSAAVGGRNGSTVSFSRATFSVPNNWMYGWLDTESSGSMAPASNKAIQPSFDRQRIGNAISIGRVVSPGYVEELDCQFREERRGWEKRVRDMEEEVRRLRCKGEEVKGCHKDGSRIDPRADVFINRVGGVE